MTGGEGSLGSRPRVLTIAGSDPSGGAGLQADLQTIARLGGYGLSVATAITAQDGARVRSVEPVSGRAVAAQLEGVLFTIGCDAVKIGMLGASPALEAVSTALSRAGDVPVVVDPVLAASDGTPLLDPEAIELLLRRLFPRATLVTPNLPEAERLSGRRLGDSTARELEAICRELGREGAAVLVKGGHATGPRVCDLLFDGTAFHRFERRRVVGPPVHGTGCVLSSAIAVGLARGDALVDAVGAGIEYLSSRLERPYELHRGAFVVNHEERE